MRCMNVSRESRPSANSSPSSLAASSRSSLDARMASGLVGAPADEPPITGVSRPYPAGGKA